VSPEMVGVLAFVVGSAAYAYFGWRCFTGRTVFWLRHPTFVDAWWPMGLYIGGALFALSVGVASVYLSEEVVAAEATVQPALRVLAGVGLGIGLPAMVFLVIVLGPLLWIEDTYRRKPDGTRLARLLLPKWYREELRRRIGASASARGVAPSGPPGGPAAPRGTTDNPAPPSPLPPPPLPPPPLLRAPRQDPDEQRGGGR
jgi:hypothetical protein